MYTYHRQVITFVAVSGFQDIQTNGITLPEHLRDPLENTTKVVLCLVRWLEPHPRARMRDAEYRPACPAPFNINHSLWRFARLRSPRRSFNADNVNEQMLLFRGRDDDERRDEAQRHEFARYDLVQPETFESFMNCTVLDEDEGTILETNTFHAT